MHAPVRHIGSHPAAVALLVDDGALRQQLAIALREHGVAVNALKGARQIWELPAREIPWGAIVAAKRPRALVRDLLEVIPALPIVLLADTASVPQIRPTWCTPSVDVQRRTLDAAELLRTIDRLDGGQLRKTADNAPRLVHSERSCGRLAARSVSVRP